MSVLHNIITRVLWWYALDIRHITPKQIGEALVRKGWIKTYYRMSDGNYGEIYRLNGKSFKIEAL
jgi:hypothetical protein